jgi:hypothetical protein
MAEVLEERGTIDDTLFTGNANPNITKPMDIAKGHRGYFFTDSVDEAKRFTGSEGKVYKATIDKDGLFDPRNPEDIAHGISMILDDPDSARKDAETSLRALEGRTWAETGAAYAQIFANLVKRA